MDEELINALKKRAKGYSFSEVQEEYSVSDDGQMSLTKRKVSEKYCPPDTAALKTYMEICRDEELSKMSDEQLEAIVGKKFKVVANLPYYITTPLAMRFIESTLEVESITIMVQKEVALRFVAKPNTPDYSAITLAIEMAGEAQITRNVSRTMFYPSPNVDSAVVRIDVDRNKLDGENVALLHKLVRSSFAMRRKTLANNLSVAFKIDKQTAAQIIVDAGFSPMVRGEALSLDDYKKLSKSLEKIIE